MSMRKLTRISVLTAVLAGSLFGGDQYLIRTNAARIGDIAARHGLTVVRELRASTNGLYLVRTQGSIDKSALAADPGVEYVESDGRLVLPEAVLDSQATPTVPGLTAAKAIDFYGAQVLDVYVNQPAATVIALGAARTFNVTGTGTVAILDTGVDTGSPALKKWLVEGYDFTRDVPGGNEMADLDQSTTAILDALQSTTAILDKNRTLVLNQSTTAILDQSTTAILDNSNLPAAFGHGTMVAGLVHLVAPTAKIMPVKVFSGDGTSTLSQIVAGIYYAVDHGANVINMSFDTPDSSPELKAAIDYAVGHGVICVASAGNEGKRAKVYPAAYGIIGVGSTNNHFFRSSFSNFGDDNVTVAAPGEGVITLYPGNNYAAAWGTSFSAPLVAGGVSLLAQLGHGIDQSRADAAVSRAIFVGQQLGAGELNLLLACLYQAVHIR